MKRTTSNGFMGIVLLALAALPFSGCGGVGTGSSSGGGGSSTTTISGKVSLSGTVSQKPEFVSNKVLSKVYGGRKAGKLMRAGDAPVTSTGMNKLFAAAGIRRAADMPGATIELYNADRPDWNCAVAEDTTDSSGNYKFKNLINATCNGDEYTNGGSIPTANYTVIASKYDSTTGKQYVAVQAIIKKFEGTVIGQDLVAQDSDAIPSIISMFGLPKNSDGTFGSDTTLLPKNTGIQIVFSMAMDRKSVLESVSIKDSTAEVSGKWKVSADLLAATFYPDADLIPGMAYTVTVGGGKALKTAKNVYLKPLSADVKGYFKATSEDNTPPTAIRNRPTSKEKTNMPITTPIRIVADEALDLNSIDINSLPKIGDRPLVKFIGKDDSLNEYKYLYEISPAGPLKLGTTYSITVSGSTDMAGNEMDMLTFSFTTEATSAGITGTTDSEINAQLAVKDVFGKWVNSLNSRNSALLTSYMSGDFYWLNNTSGGMSSDDLNRDGRLSLNEFTGMLNKWFNQLEHCGSTVTGNIDETAGGIQVSGSTATIAFNIESIPTNTLDPSCKEGPQSTMYAVLENINSAWIMTRGSEKAISSYPSALNLIEMNSPANGSQYSAPSGTPLTPDFKWTVPTLASGDPQITTYMVVLVDTISMWQGTGWVALIDGTSATAGSELSVKFNPVAGDYGNISVLSVADTWGFYENLTEIKAGGNYYWAVLGFKTKTISDFKIMGFDPSDFLTAAGEAKKFSVEGVWKELQVQVSDASATTFYDYQDYSNAYDVGSAGTVKLTITTPDSSATGAYVSVNGYTSFWYDSFSTPSLVFASGVATVDINLSRKRNQVYVSDGMGLWKEFSIFTTGGLAPKIVISSISAKTCAGGASSLVGPDAWENYVSADTCTITVNGSVDPSITGTLNLNVWNDNGNGQYGTNFTLSGTSFTFTDVPVYTGRNWINVGGSDSVGMYHNNNFGIETAAGATYQKPIDATVSILDGTTITNTSSDIYGSYWTTDADTVSIGGTMLNDSAGSAQYSHYAEPDWIILNSGTLTLTPGTPPYYDITPVTIGLRKGWNYVYLSDGMGSWYYLNIYTTGGAAYTPPHVITTIDSSPVLPQPGYYQQSTSACSVTIAGETDFSGSIYVYLNNYNSATGKSYYEYQTLTPAGSGPYTYTVTQNVYSGENYIDIYDGNWKWQGVRVTTSGSCAATVFDVTSIKAGVSTLTPNMYGEYDAGSSPKVTIQGTAKNSDNVTVYVSGQYYTSQSTTAASGTFTLTDVPIYTGYNYLSITDGYNWIYKTVYTSSGAAWTPPINTVAVDPAYLTSGGGTSDNWASWNTSAGTVTITGSSTANGTGTYYLSGTTYTSGSFTISGGLFSLSNLPLDYGYNYLSLYDANWNYYSLTIYSSGGTGAPTKYVSIISPVHNDSLSGPITVTGTTDSSFVPQYVYGYTYDYTTGISTAFSSDPYYQTTYGYQPVTVSGNGFSFDTTINSGNQTLIEAYACDASGYCHGEDIYVNNIYNYSSYYWKPGNKSNANSAKATAHKTEFLKRVLKRKAR